MVSPLLNIKMQIVEGADPGDLQGTRTSFSRNFKNLTPNPIPV
jgi:hypothetical protein